MYKNKTESGCNNICGSKVKKIRESMEPKTSQRVLSLMLKEAGLDVDKNAVQRIEAGKRFVTDIEIISLAKVLNKSFAELSQDEKNRISHRARAYAKALEFVEDELSVFTDQF